MVSLGFKLKTHVKTGECQTVYQYHVSDQGCMETNMKTPANLHSGVQGTLQAVGGLKVSQGWRTSQKGKHQILNISDMQIIGEFFFIKRFKY